MIYPINAGIIIETDKRFPLEYSAHIFEKAIKFAGEGVVGVDISGLSREKFDIDGYIPLYASAQKAGLGTTIHTGEVTGPDEMREIITKLNPKRIGHGFRCSEDPALMAEIVKRGIVLEICPSSNLATQAIKDRDDMAQRIAILKKHKVPFTINTDGPVSFVTNVAKEFKTLYEKNILSLEDIEQCKSNAKKAGFVR